ncbi:MAG TPA: tRNA (adenosine(37)-N6)-threonylcarbamoyltransferase complex ATPase subunit type 1 TsaE [Candidatus Aminicenantes bacterium]|nr:tRNA (adenosine(37)-N6)-threonylcarbamoyltransferase complex ATPase subunit type 1 TsaE [Candidatus Aminicenantes bacterium]HRY66222.1 tRNA (adenosine(37)-N6)-threonylcarbamoyltransferase complex ATPase subunit type 1 TsaE [Candidatus Aminicenantes bacterium]HRZ73136.1 tRNA (adenosine(37)-N6)-threonylcarbamoyltransferase complex ATPase subunit type 1 TsaE [Candidatus Aminicenantes bacterium]
MSAVQAMSGTRTVTTGSDEETFELARKMAAGFAGTEVVLLVGELGAGKTVFAKGLAAGLGVADPGIVSSPSYTLVNVYEGRHRVFHIDLYRLEGEAEIADLGWEDMLGQGVVIVEWAEKLTFPVDAVRVRIETTGDDERRITIG